MPLAVHQLPFPGVEMRRSGRSCMFCFYSRHRYFLEVRERGFLSLCEESGDRRIQSYRFRQIRSGKLYHSRIHLTAGRWRMESGTCRTNTFHGTFAGLESWGLQKKTGESKPLGLHESRLLSQTSYYLLLFLFDALRGLIFCSFFASTLRCVAKLQLLVFHLMEGFG